MIRRRFVAVVILSWVMAPSTGSSSEKTTRLEGIVLDREAGTPIPSRIYIEDESGEWRFVETSNPAGSAVRYDVRRGESVEAHTTLSAHPFHADLPSGTYKVAVERGKEYKTLRTTLEIGDSPTSVTFELDRWIDMATRGWWSGDTHVHRNLADLPNIMAAEDLNVAFPLTYWAWDGYEPPKKEDPDFDPSESDAAKLVEIDPTHVIHPLNTEYEIARIHGKPHGLGAFFILNHKTPFEVGVPPVGNILEKARNEGALFELDKHNWPWSMMLVPVLDVDLYELSNNHVWRTQFLFRDFGLKPSQRMEVEQRDGGFTEWGWLRYGFENYYTLLNCGFRLRPTAGTASGVHPVPLGFGRVYVHLPEGFSYEGWLAGLNDGRSFVTTGPMLFVEIDGRPAKVHYRRTGDAPTTVHIRGEAVSPDPIDRIEVIQNGKAIQTLRPDPPDEEGSVHRVEFEMEGIFEETAWFAVRCFSLTDEGRIRFAHSSPSFVDYADRPLRPDKEEVEFLIRRMEEQIEWNAKLENEEVLNEYRRALEVYRELLETAR